MIYRAKYNHRLLAAMRLEELYNPIMKQIQKRFINDPKYSRQLTIYGESKKEHMYFVHAIGVLIRLLTQKISPFSLNLNQHVEGDDQQTEQYFAGSKSSPKL